MPTLAFSHSSSGWRPAKPDLGTRPCRQSIRRYWHKVRNVGGPSQSSLRFIRSSSAALPPQVMTELEALFGVPVLEAYGMTEASHQMACNPLPPGQRKGRPQSDWRWAPA